MPHISAIKKSRFLTRADCKPPILVTIASCTEMNVAAEGAPEEMKWCLSFRETEKPMVLNSTNAQIIALITGQEITEKWTGSRLVLYDDPNIQFGGKLTGGIRARAPRNPGTAGAPAFAPQPDDPKPVGAFLAAAIPTEPEAEDVPF